MSAPRRFYKRAAVSADGQGVLLDARLLKTPARNDVRLPTRALAEAVAAEWDAQGEHILPSAMALTQLAFAAIDHGPSRRGDLIAHIIKHAETDLVCHRATSPAELAARQALHWDSLRDWFAATIGADLPVIAGVAPARLAPGETAKVRAAAEALDDFRLAGLAHATGVAGSAVLGFAIAFRAVTPGAAFEAAALDELWSLEKWGEDGEARARLDRQRADLAATSRYFAALA